MVLASTSDILHLCIVSLNSTLLFYILCFYSRDVTKVSIFNFTVPEEMNQLFNVVGSMLSYPDQTARHFWKTCKFKDRIETCFVSIWLVRRKDEEPSCFQMMMVPLSECDGVWSEFCCKFMLYTRAKCSVDIHFDCCCYPVCSVCRAHEAANEASDHHHHRRQVKEGT